MHFAQYETYKNQHLKKVKVGYLQSTKMNKTGHLKKVKIKREGKFKKLNITELTESELEDYLGGKKKEFLIELAKKLVSELKTYKPEFNFDFEWSELDFEWSKFDFKLPDFELVPGKKKSDDS